MQTDVSAIQIGFEELKHHMEGVRNEGRAIIYIDEIHNLIGAGRTGDGSMDASNMLKPYLESGDIRFIGSTTYEEYNRYFARSKGLVRRFQQIDILEPSIEETIHIVEGLKKKYEEFHGVTYQPDVIPYAVKASVRYISDRFLPDKAIDLVDEAGAYREIHPISSGEQIVDKTLITDVLARICKVDALAMKEEDTTSLETLHARISAKIYGQEEAVRQVVEAVQMSKAGLLDENKPLASLLFVGPTGVGKTEVAKVLASELGISLQRFDMSEYTEKHTVAKLIGSPAGYVGYEDGGLLTDAIRKTPNCVLLLDEIEKAHPDVFNILLQVMDTPPCSTTAAHLVCLYSHCPHNARFRRIQPIYDPAQYLPKFSVAVMIQKELHGSCGIVLGEHCRPSPGEFPHIPNPVLLLFEFA